jgi:Pregnancy-associated plasma protein-A/Secretion system C-terminal sorting domain
MSKKFFLLLGAIALMTNAAFAQKTCMSDVEYENQLQRHPEIAKIESDLEAQIQAGIKHIDFSKAARTMDAGDTFWYDIPVVVHFIHDFGSEYLSDDNVFNAIVGWNQVYAGANPDTADVIKPFKPYIGNPRIRLHLATVDPYGNPTKGITRRRSYITGAANDQAKFDDWDNTAYVNIWVVNSIAPSPGLEAAAYAIFPSAAAVEPYYDGVIADASYLKNQLTYLDGPYFISKTINHEMGHVFNLEHPWGSTNNPEVACGDDGVDDTPPTKGHLPVSNPSLECYPSHAPKTSPIYDTVCATNKLDTVGSVVYNQYYKSYPTSSGDSIVYFPDTTNAQNIMDYTYCAMMFTKGQVARMHDALNSDVAHRDSLWSPANLARTGAFAARPDLPAIPDFNVKNYYTGQIQYFTAPGVALQFINESWNDTIESVSWTFSNSAAASPVSSTTNFTNSFATPGWVTLNMSAQGNNTAAGTLTSTPVFVTNATATNASGYYQEFLPSGDVNNWPIFNYYNNNFKWQPATVGYWDNHSIMYAGFDSTAGARLTGAPEGDIDDFFSVPLDLTSFGTSGPCNLNFLYSGATRTSNLTDMNDSMSIYYSTDSSKTWHELMMMSGTTLDNMGTDATYYTPSSADDWAPMTLPIPAAARTSYTLFRFRYYPGNNNGTYESYAHYSTGNNFYMDRINFSTAPATVSAVNLENEIAVVPNPTHSDAYVVIKDGANQNVNIVVTDVAGKVVFTTTEKLQSGAGQIEIPKTALSVSGMYFVQVTTGAKTQVQKLVVY